MLSKLRAINRARIRRRRMGLVTPNSTRSHRHQRPKYLQPTTTSPSSATPLVSVIIVGYNGARHLYEVLASLSAQTYPNFETIYVDNASTDDSCDLVARLMPQAKVVRSETNTGFAEGNNIGVDHARGEFLLLLNNDARLEPETLQRMVSALCADVGLGVIAPKIRFWEPFVDCELSGTGLPLNEVEVAISESTTGYRKVITLPGHDQTTRRLRIPESARKLSAGYRAFDIPNTDKPKPQLMVDGKPASWDSELPTMSGHWVINNAGSWVSDTGDAGDWGFGEPDAGQYDDPVLVDAFCGCCALIRRSALGLKPLFPASFFAYFEDTEASERVTASGFNILYLPSAVAYHKHASTSVEHSPFFTYFVRRNHAAFQAAHFKFGNNQQLLARLDSWHADGSGSLTSGDILGRNPYSNELGLTEDTLRLTAQACNGAIYQRKPLRKRIGIYNEFWESRGGGELRALHVAQQLTTFGDVYLISQRHLDINDLCRHFGMSAGELKLAVVPEFSEKDTADVDIFVNTAFNSKIYSRASKSAYLVSFPHVDGHISTMHSYNVVLANSRFTEQWCNNFWPDARVELLYPSVEQPASVSVDNKKRMIVSIGRFFESGHNKKQLEMIEAFAQLINKHGMSGWRLMLIGGCNPARSSDNAYLDRVKQKAAGLPVDVVVDANADFVQAALRDGSIYWHATGVGLTDFEPARFEHFGMAIVEAMSHGMVPVVHNRGGAPEILEGGKSGYHFASLDDLIERTLKLAQLRENTPQAFFDLANAAHTRAKLFSSEAHRRQLDSLAGRYLACNSPKNC